jgi:hypothetical protein
MTTDDKDADDAAVKPRVIDLEAEDVTVESDPPQDSAPPPPPRGRKSGGTMRWVTGALIVGGLAGGWLYRDFLSDYFPAAEITGLRARVGTLEAGSKTHTEQLAAVSGTVDSVSGKLTSLEQLTTESVAQSRGGQEKIAAIESRVAALEENLKITDEDLARLQTAIASISVKPGTGAPDPAALVSLGLRIDALEKDIASLKSRGSGDSNNRTAAMAALSQSLSDLKAKIAAGTSYRDELDRIARMVPAAAGLDVLQAHAAEGLPAPAGLAAELRAAIPALPRPDATPDSGGYWDGLWNTLTSVVKIRDIGEADWPALAEDCAALAQSSDLPQAIARIDAAEGAIPQAINHWRERAAARLKLEAALAGMAQAVERQIVSLGGGQ